MKIDNQALFMRLSKLAASGAAPSPETGYATLDQIRADMRHLLSSYVLMVIGVEVGDVVSIDGVRSLAIVDFTDATGGVFTKLPNKRCDIFVVLEAFPSSGNAGGKIRLPASGLCSKNEALSPHGGSSRIRPHT